MLVTFDPSNKEHLMAYYNLRYKGKMHPTLRFEVKKNFPDVISTMHHAIAEELLRTRLGTLDFEY